MCCIKGAPIVVETIDAPLVMQCEPSVVCYSHCTVHRRGTVLVSAQIITLDR